MATMTDLDRAAAVLREARDVAIACHVNPDADALGSSLGLAHHLVAGGAQVVVGFPNEPLELPVWAAALPVGDLVVPVDAFPTAPAVMVTCDCAAFDRLGVLGAAADAAAELIWIDHHRSNDGRGTIRLVDPDASSTCEVVARLLDAIGGDISDESAICLYAGLVTDTGRFQYEAASPDTLRLAARLREHPFDHARLSQVLYENNRAAYLDVLGVAMERAELDPVADLVWTYVTQADLVRASVDVNELDDVIDVVRMAREADVACVIKQQADGRFRVSLRSRGKTDVGAVAQGFGGGGHRLAAGYTSTTGLEDTALALIDELRGPPARPVDG